MAILKSIGARLSNKGSILGLSALVISLIAQFGVEIESEKVMAIITTVTTILVSLGILNDSTSDNKAMYIPGISDKLVEKKVEPVVEPVNTTEVVENIVKGQE